MNQYENDRDFANGHTLISFILYRTWDNCLENKATGLVLTLGDANGLSLEDVNMQIDKYDCSILIWLWLLVSFLFNIKYTVSAITFMRFPCSEGTSFLNNLLICHSFIDLPYLTAPLFQASEMAD